jgi:16S rRNA (cytosine967-C5)-methyltransferase
MIIHPNLIAGICHVLEQILSADIPADYALKKTLQANPKWGSRDRRMISSAVYDIVRHKILLTEKFQTNTLQNIIQQYFEYRPACLLPQADFSSDINYSIPPSLHQLGITGLGRSRWEREIACMNQVGPIYIRINYPLQATEFIRHELTQKQIPYEEKTMSVTTDKGNKISFPYFMIPKRFYSGDLQCFKQGACEIQDIGSQVISYFASPKGKKNIIDACCGNGGKSIHMATLADKNTPIFSFDIMEAKIKRLKLRAAQQKIHQIKVGIIDSQTLVQFAKKADLLLLDVPCTGIGTIKRQPELKYKINPTTLAQKVHLQQEIFNNYAGMVKSGGELVYSTCSIFPSENESQVDLFLQTHPEFTLQDTLTLFPSEHESDGFFMAKLVKK